MLRPFKNLKIKYTILCWIYHHSVSSVHNTIYNNIDAEYDVISFRFVSFSHFVNRLTRNATSFFALLQEKGNHGWNTMKVRRNIAKIVRRNVSYTSRTVLILLGKKIRSTNWSSSCLHTRTSLASLLKQKMT